MQGFVVLAIICIEKIHLSILLKIQTKSMKHEM